MKATKNNTTSLAHFKDKHYGKRGKVKRERLEAGFEKFKIEALQKKAQ